MSATSCNNAPRPKTERLSPLSSGNYSPGYSAGGLCVQCVCRLDSNRLAFGYRYATTARLIVRDGMR